MQLATVEMAQQEAQIVVRVPQEMADQLKEYALRLSKEFGVPVSASSATRRLIAEGLEREGITVQAHPVDERTVPKKAVKRRSPKR